MSIDVQHLRLYPIHLQATVTAKGLDLSLARLYLPPDAPVILDQGRVSSSLKVALDARAGVRADVTGEFEDIVLVRPGERDPVTRVPKLTAQVTGFEFQDGRIRVGQFEVRGSATFEIRGRQGRLSDLDGASEHLRSHVARHHARPARADRPGGGNSGARGHGAPPPAPSQLSYLTNVDLPVE
jgi:hypothetical protein